MHSFNLFIKPLGNDFSIFSYLFSIVEVCSVRTFSFPKLEKFAIFDVFAYRVYKNNLKKVVNNGLNLLFFGVILINFTPENVKLQVSKRSEFTLLRIKLSIKDKICLRKGEFIPLQILNFKTV